MKTAVIISEYNPFHFGHKYHIEQTRKLGATHIIAVMSGNIVQRGDVAIYDKHMRAECAVRNGCDLVLELPYPYSCSSAERFARGGVAIANGIGITDMLSFGSENGDVSVLRQAAEATITLEKSEEVRRLIGSGISYPKAVFEAAKGIISDEALECLSSPNNTLAIEYIKALNSIDSKITPVTIKRTGAGHDESFIDGKFTSASNIRSMISENSDFSKYIPELISQPHRCLENMASSIIFELSRKTAYELSKAPDITSELAQRIIMVLRKLPTSFNALADGVKSKNFTHSRIRRALLSSYFGITTDDFSAVPYARVLAMGCKGGELLSAISKSSNGFSVSASLAELSRISPLHNRIAQLDEITSRFANMCGCESVPYNSEFLFRLKPCD